MPGVDRDRVYAAGHSIGGVLALLATQTAHGFRKVVSFSGMPDLRAFGLDSADPLCVFDCGSEAELRVRSPVDWASSLTAPARLFYGSEEVGFASACRRTADSARSAGIDAAAIEVPGDHHRAVRPAMQQAIAWFRQDER